MTERRTGRRFTAEFKLQAVQRLVESGRSPAAVAAELEIGVGQLNAWAVDRLIPALKSLAAQRAGDIGCKIQSLEHEVEQLKAERAEERRRSECELKRLQAENLILRHLAIALPKIVAKAALEGKAASQPAKVRRRDRPWLPSAGPLGKLDPSFAAPGGTSLYSASKNGTPEQLESAFAITGGRPGPDTFAEFFRLTQNPIWLWVALRFVEHPAEMPAEVFSYLRSAATAVFSAVVAQVDARDVLRILEGETLDEGIVRQAEQPPTPPDMADILGFSHPGRNLFRSAAQDFRAMSAAVAVEAFHARGYRIADIYEFLAKGTGRVSPEAGPGVEHVKKVVGRGRAFIKASRGTKKPR